jgi:predicted cytidylate kinase
MTVTISGPPGSGKTTVGRLVAGIMSLPFKSTGEAFRAIAVGRGLTLAELGALAETDHSIDRELDAGIVATLRAGPIVLEGRLAGHLCVRNSLPAFKVWIDAPVEVRAFRIAGREGKVADAVASEMRARERSERMRYKEIYGIDFGDTSVYDLVLDSRSETPEALAAKVVEEARRHG